MFDLLTAAKLGALKVGRLNDPDQFLLILIGTDGDYAIPMLKVGSATYAYVDPDTDTETYDLISAILEEINKRKFYTGLYQFKPILKNPPEHSHEVKDFVPESLGTMDKIMPENLKSLLSAHGYIYEPAVSSCASTYRRDYTDICAEPKYKALLDATAKKLMKENATFESLPKQMRMLYPSIENGQLSSIIAFGNPGTGKSWAAAIIAEKMKAPLVTISCSAGIDVDALIGGLRQNDEGRWKLTPGPLLESYSKGATVLLDEVNGLAPENAIALFPFADPGCSYVTYNNETYYKHPNFVLFMTMNPGFKGTDTLSSALKNRSAIVNFTITPEEMINRAVRHSEAIGHRLGESFFKTLYDIGLFVEKTAKSWHENVQFSVRNMNALTDVILSKRMNFDEFYELVKVNYFNLLSLDNNNIDRLNAITDSDEVKNLVKDLYGCYDYFEPTYVKVTASLKELYIEDAPGADGAGDDGRKPSDKFVDEAFKAFGV